MQKIVQDNNASKLIHIDGSVISMINAEIVTITSYSKKQDIELNQVEWWPTVYDAGPTLNQQWFNVYCLLG